MGWQVRDFRVGNKVVEFGLRLPNNLVLPIDSKWPATTHLEQFLASDSETERKKLKGLIEQSVLAKAREVKKYLEPGLTVGFRVAVVPDAVCDLCSALQPEVFREGAALAGASEAAHARLTPTRGSTRRDGSPSPRSISWQRR